jgi:biotin transport system substrate-specific component
MNSELALVPQILILRGNKAVENVLSVIVGLFLLSLLAQIAIPLPWTPVPITGQTFGIALTALLWGRKRGIAIAIGYVTLGAAGLPVFASGKSGISWGPTSGYLMGMLVSSYVMGAISDRMRNKTFLKIYGAAFLGSVITFVFGLLGLSFFISKEGLLMAGLIPFLPGDLIKTLLVSFFVKQSQRIKA